MELERTDTPCDECGVLQVSESDDASEPARLSSRAGTAPPRVADLHGLRYMAPIMSAPTAQEGFGVGMDGTGASWPNLRSAHALQPDDQQ